MRDENQMWEIVDAVISEEQKENEAIYSMKDGSVVVLVYAGIENHKLHQARVHMEIWVLRTVSVPTMRLIIREVIEDMRVRAE